MVSKQGLDIILKNKTNEFSRKEPIKHKSHSSKHGLQQSW